MRRLRALCLPVCPTFVVSRLEQHGPRGRILGMRLVHAGELPPDDPGFVDSIETCVQCRACEAMCPSGVAFGALMELARADAADRRPSTGWRRVAEAVGFWVLSRRRPLQAATAGLSLLQAVRLAGLMPPRWRVPIRLGRQPLIPVEGGTGERPAVLFRVASWTTGSGRCTAPP